MCAARCRRAESKGAQILEMIRRPEGATLAEIMRAAGWQATAGAALSRRQGKSRDAEPSLPRTTPAIVFTRSSRPPNLPLAARNGRLFSFGCFPVAVRRHLSDESYRIHGGYLRVASEDANL